jgi:hypothetical protein
MTSCHYSPAIPANVSMAAGCPLPRRDAEASSAGLGGAGLALFKAIAEFSQTPPRPSNAAYRREAAGDEFGSPFFCLRLDGEAKNK